MNKVTYWLTRWRESADPHVGLDSLLARAHPEAPAEERLEWLYDLGAWLRSDVRRDGEAPATSAQAIRLKHLLSMLERDPARKLAFATALRTTLAENDAFDLLTETGLPRESGFLGEFTNRMLVKFLPEPPPEDLAELFPQIFPDRDAAANFESIDESIWLGALDLLSHGDEPSDVRGYRARIAAAAERALGALAMNVAGATQASALRRRMEEAPGDDLPTARLPFAVENFLVAKRAGDAEGLAREHENLKRELGASLLAVESGYQHLDRKGVSIGIVYQFERVRAQVQRIGELADLVADPARGRPALRFFLASLIRDVHDHLSVRALLRQNFSLLSRKIVERSAETGEHYIAHDRAEYFDMFKRALGGGAFTAFTVYIKFLTSHLKLPAFFDGLLASMNYSISFVAIQLCGFTLATKQPAMTAPALARKMQGVDDPKKMDALVDEVADLVRSQSAAIFGNLLAVAPVAVAIYYLLTSVVGLAPVDPEKALKVMDSLSIWGPTLLFAAFTGVLLWFSSVVAGWVENWFVYRELGPAIEHHRRLRYVFGPSGARRIARFFEHEIAGFASNVSLGFMLGSIPVILLFYGVPLEVRHVTLSTGQLASAVSALGVESMLRPGFWLAVAGIAGIGTLNLGVSFALALNVAIRARGISGVTRWRVYRAIIRRMISRPATFLFPPRAPADPRPGST
ncbi:site-specific recombinase [Usitatibacter palustris]|uniref:Site-specific recombinase n=1 Tax=Usitatibacter palustris TaxID=2732487 RepID=A0A6M4HFW2_9PROT|nr:site-specific recombinase [Usitatibacter palustris]QJR16927.1 hypothetical protein DSM104440_03764 [Usitatibacter palustris]